MTVSVGILPVTLQALIRLIQLRTAFSRQAEELNKQLPPSETGRFPEEGDSDEAHPVIDFSSDNGQERIELSLATFLYAEAADNYVKFFYTAGGKPEHKMIRSSLKRLEDAISGHAGFYRCHRTYIVNLRKVIHISGNAQGYKLHLDGVSTLIPVSRNLNKEIAGLVAGPKRLPDRPINL
jgi:DNA-binding LytR/AlgR family response regulator